MELKDEDSLSEGCERPQHLRVDQWYVHHDTRFGLELWSEPSEHERLELKLKQQIHELKLRKSRRRIEKWWRKPTELAYSSGPPSNQKLAEAKRRQFTVQGKQE